MAAGGEVALIKAIVNWWNRSNRSSLGGVSAETQRQGGESDRHRKEKGELASYCDDKHCRTLL